MRLRGAADQCKSLRELSASILSAPGSSWKSVEDPLRHVPGASAATEYAEFVYFHPFVRAFLYPSPQQDHPDLVILQRDDIHSVEVQFEHAAQPMARLEVLRVQFYLVAGDVAALVLELRGGPLPLQSAERILDSLRRTYTPYWESDAPGHCPSSVRWLARDETAVGPPGDYIDSNVPVAGVRLTRQPPLAAHWAYLLHPLTPFCQDTAPGGAIVFEHLDDERMAVLFHASFLKPFDLSDGDMIRLGMADDPGPSATFPYAEKFLNSFFVEHAYDRYWEKEVSGTTHKTRYLMMGYSFGMIGEHSFKEGKPELFINGETGALAHFRHHYFQLGLILQLQRAMLLTIWDQLSEIMRPPAPVHPAASSSAWDTAFSSLERAARTMSARPTNVEQVLTTGAARALASIDWSESRQVSHELLQNLLKLQERFVNFTARIWFTEVSSHLQARELYELWSRHLGVRELYERVRQETELAAGFYRSRQENIQSQASLNLNRVATYGLPIGILLQVFPSWVDGLAPKASVFLLALLVGFAVGNLLDRCFGRNR